MSVLVATSDGYHIFTSSGKHLTALEGRALGALAPGPDDTWVAIVDGREVWQHAADGTWCGLATADVDLSSLVTVAGVVFAGTYTARMFRLDDDKLVPLESFDRIANRDEWHQVGPALNVRSMTATCDEQVLLANVHVGGIQRSTDLGDDVGAHDRGRSRRARSARASHAAERGHGGGGRRIVRERRRRRDVVGRGRRAPRSRTRGPSPSPTTTCS